MRHGLVKRLRCAVLALLAVLLSTSPRRTYALDIETRNSATPHEVLVYLRGPIERGDASIFRADMDDIPREAHVSVWLSSMGGVVQEALEIGRLIRHRSFATYAMSGNGTVNCASACVFLLLGGVERMVDDGSVAIHRPTFRDAAFLASNQVELRDAYQRLLASVKQYLVEMGASDELYEAMLRIPSNDLLPLSVKMAQRFNIEGTDPFWDERQRATKHTR